VQEPNTLDHLRLTFAYTDPEFALTVGGDPNQDPFKVFKEGSAVVLSLGYTDNLSKIFEGEITGLVVIFPEEEAATLEVHCHSYLHRLIASAVTKTYTKQKDSMIAAQVGRA